MSDTSSLRDGIHTTYHESCDVALRGKTILSIEGCLKGCSATLAIPWENGGHCHKSVTMLSSQSSMQTINLPKFVEDILLDLNLSLGNVNVICANAGPGSFTGIRSSLAFAEGLVTPKNKLKHGSIFLKSQGIGSDGHKIKRGEDGNFIIDFNFPSATDKTDEESGELIESVSATCNLVVAYSTLREVLSWDTLHGLRGEDFFIVTAIEALQETFYFQVFNRDLDEISGIAYVSKEELHQEVLSLIDKNRNAFYVLSGYHCSPIFEMELPENVLSIQKDFLPNSLSLLNLLLSFPCALRVGYAPVYVRGAI